MKKTLSLLTSIILTTGLLAGCGTQGNPKAENGSTAKEKISLWFWGAPPTKQTAMQEILADKYNNSQDKYELTIEFRNTVDKDISVALSADQGPDIVYGSGPSFVMPLATAKKLEPLDKYSEKYGWKDRILDPIYKAGTVNGTLYSLGNSLNTMGIFYNKEVLKENGWEIPKTIEDLEKIMDEAMAKGMYASVTGNKGWKPVNENYASLFLTHFAGPDTVYKCLLGEEKWSNPEVINAINKSAEWYKKGYLAGEDYVNLNFSEAVQLLADKRSPFFIGPTLVYQFASDFFKDDKADNLGFIPFPSGKEEVEYPTYTLGVTATLSINANSKHKDEAAKILDMMMSQEFMQEMTEVWPGYWGVPLKDMNIDMSKMKGLSKSYSEALIQIADSINNGNFGYYTGVFFPTGTQQVFIDIETVWNETYTAEELMEKADKEFAKELEQKLVPPIPKSGK